MDRIITGLAALAALSAAAAGAQAQTIDESLRGVTRFDILVEQLDADSAACGITEDGLAGAVRAAARGAGFALDGYDYTLYVRVNTLPKRGDCFSSVDMEAYYYGRLALPNFPQGNNAEVVLWENGTILISPQGRHGRDVGEIVQRFTRDLVNDWIKDNSGS